MRTIVIADEDTVLGFSFAGVQGVIVNTPDETRNAFDQATRQQDAGIIVITERAAQTIRDMVDKWILKPGTPVILEIPDGHGPMEGRRTPHDFVKSAIGIKF